MRKIPAEVVDRTWEEFADATPEEATRTIQRMAAEQPAVLAYLMEPADELNEDEKQVLLYVGTVVWRIFLGAGIRLKQVSDTLLLKIEEAQTQRLQGLADAPEVILTEEALGRISQSPQPEVLRYITEAIMEDEEESDAEIRDEMKGLLFLYLTTVLEAFCRSEALNIPPRKKR